MVITNSPDIGVLEVKVVYDLSGVNPVINLTNQTTAKQNVSPIPNLANLVWVLNIYSPTGTPIFQSTFAAPWKSAGFGNWTTAAITAAWPRPFGQIEWSEYKIKFQVKDTAGNIYELNKNAEICRPSGNNKNYQDTFGHIKLNVETLCAKASLYISDGSSKMYRGITGVNQSSYLAVDYPRDSTGTLPPPYVLTTFVTDALVPFFQNGEHEATYYSIWQYDLGDNVFIVIRYTSQVAFATQCNIDLCPIACEVQALEESITSGSCTNVAEAQRKLNLITPKLLRAFIARANPTCGIDLPKLVEEIKEIGGFACDCNTGTSGIGSSSSGASVPPFIFSVNNEGGDVVASFQVTDGNVVLNIKDKAYTFIQGNDAIQLITSIGETSNIVNLSVNLNDLAEDIYQTTAASAYLLQLFNDLVINAGFQLTVDGKCVISNNACDISWGLAPITGSNAILRTIVVGGVVQELNYIFNIGTLAALQTYLNMLGLGTFVVSNLGGGSIEIATTSNTSNLGDIVYIYSGGSEDLKQTAVITKDCNSLAPLSPSQIVQSIIDWLCPLSAGKVYTTEQYTVCYADPVTKTKKTQVIPSASNLPAFFAALVSRGCDTVDFIMNLKSVNCATIQGLFMPSSSLMGANDWLMATKQGNCARVGPVELGLRQLQLGIYDQAFVEAFCAIVKACGGGNICQPYNLFSVSGLLDSPSSNLMAAIVSFVHPEAVSSLIRYARIDQGGALDWSEPVSALPGTSPYAISNLDEGQYLIGATPVYADGRLCGEVQKSTEACGTISSFSASFDGTDINVSYSATSPKVRVTVQYPNGGSFVQIYTTGDPIVIAPPSSVVGTYSVVIQSVCNETTNWYGPFSAPSIFDITPANNSTVTNNASIALSLVLISVVNSLGEGALIKNITSLPISAVENFYIEDGFYSEISLQCLSTSLGWTVYLVTGTGVYNVNGSGIFEDVTISGGAQIVILDSSPL